MNINDFSPLVSNVSDSNVSESKDNANFNTEKATDTQGIISLSNLKVLLVDDQHTFVVMMKSMLNALGFSKIDIANNADQAIKICKNNTYDVYLFDYNLGPGLNGRQLIEYLDKQNKLPYTSVVLIVTGDNSRAMVLSAVEQEPDDYVIKPFSQLQFKQRLFRAMTRRRILENVYKAQHEKNNDDMIQALEWQLSNSTPYEIFCRCLLANCYVNINKFDLAKAILNEGLSMVESSYLRLSLGKVLYEEKNYYDAIEQLEQVIQKHPLLIEALKCLTYAYIDSGQTNLAMQTIKRAVLISPMSVPLLQLQIDMSLKSQDYLLARDSIGLLLEVNKYYPKEVENLLSSFVQCEFQFVQSSGDAYHISNMQKQIRNVLSRYKKHLDPNKFNSILFDSVCTARIQMIKGENGKGKRTLYKAYTTCEEPENISRSIMGHIFLGFQQVGEYEIADQIKNTLLKPAANDSDSGNDTSNEIFEHCINTYKQDQSFIEKQQKYKELNLSGISAYKEGHLSEALEFFKEALKKIPTNTNVMLNKVQVLIDLCDQYTSVKNNENKHKLASLLGEAEQGLQTLEGLNLTAAQLERTGNLRKDINNLKAK
jgi:CheY-like chemotaxis protein